VSEFRLQAGGKATLEESQSFAPWGIMAPKLAQGPNELAGELAGVADHCVGRHALLRGAGVTARCLTAGGFSFRTPPCSNVASLLVDPADGLGPLGRSRHFNTGRAQLRSVAALPAWPWSSLHGLMTPRLRPSWYAPDAALDHAGGSKDTAAGRAKYLDYLARV
jgi:hypothetical protein